MIKLELTPQETIILYGMLESRIEYFDEVSDQLEDPIGVKNALTRMYGNLIKQIENEQNGI